MIIVVSIKHHTTVFYAINMYDFMIKKSLGFAISVIL